MHPAGPAIPETCIWSEKIRAHANGQLQDPAHTILTCKGYRYRLHATNYADIPRQVPQPFLEIPLDLIRRPRPKRWTVAFFHLMKKPFFEMHTSARYSLMQKIVH